MTLHKDSLRVRDLNGTDVVIDTPWVDMSTGQRYPAQFGEHELTDADAAEAARWLAPEVFKAARDAVDKVIAELDRIHREHDCDNDFGPAALRSNLSRAADMLLDVQAKHLGGEE